MFSSSFKWKNGGVCIYYKSYSFIIDILETYLYSNILPDDRISEVSGYNSLRSHHLSNKKWRFLYILQGLFAFNLHQTINQYQLHIFL